MVRIVTVLGQLVDAPASLFLFSLLALGLFLFQRACCSSLSAICWRTRLSASALSLRMSSNSLMAGGATANGIEHEVGVELQQLEEVGLGAFADRPG